MPSPSAIASRVCVPEEHALYESGVHAREDESDDFENRTTLISADEFEELVDLSDVQILGDETIAREAALSERATFDPEDDEAVSAAVSAAAAAVSAAMPVSVGTSSFQRGTKLGRYELLVPVANGGMANVWAAMQHGPGGVSRVVALKTIRPHLACDPDFDRMFIDEARVASLVQHPNVCEFYELGGEGSVRYLAMEWVHGESLTQVLRNSTKKQGAAPLPFAIAARIVADACAGLHAVHELEDEHGKPLNCVHRDVSPHNILVSVGGHVKVIDFGVAKALGQLHQATVVGQIKGKLQYMAPERLGGGAFDRRSDVFSLGCVLYEATTGLPAFLGEHDYQVMNALMRCAYIRPSDLVTGYPAGLESIIVKALQADPNARFASAEEMRLALEAWLDSLDTFVHAAHVAETIAPRLGEAVEKRRAQIREALRADSAYAGPIISTQPRVHLDEEVIAAAAAFESALDGTRSAIAAPPISAIPDFRSGAVRRFVRRQSKKLGIVFGVTAAAAAAVVILAHTALAPAKPVASVEPATSEQPAARPAPPRLETPAPAVAAPLSVMLKTTPANATIVIEQTALPPGVREVRHFRGEPVTIQVLAAGYTTVTRTLDDQTPKALDIVLTKSTGVAAKRGAAAVPVAWRGDETLPDSPY